MIFCCREKKAFKLLEMSQNLFAFFRLSPRLSGRPNGAPTGVISPIASSSLPSSRHASDLQQHQQQQQQHQIRSLGGNSITALPEEHNNNLGTPGASSSTASPSPLSCNPLLGSSEYLKPLHELPNHHRHIGNNGKIQNGVHAPPSYTQGTLF